MRKFGFKIFSTDIEKSPELIKECAQFTSLHNDVFIELMVVADSSKDDLIKIKNQIEKVEVRIHVPHNTMGFDAGNKELEKQNQKIFTLSQKAADIFSSETIVVHAGCGTKKENINETIRQFKLLNDSRIVVENLPLYASNNETLHGNTASEIKYITQETGCGFCFDFSHAICAALALNQDIETQLSEFFALKPTVYHMCDGDMSKAEDLHLHFGAGNYPLKHFLNDLTDQNAYITMETGKGMIEHNDLWVKDYFYLKSLQY